MKSRNGILLFLSLVLALGASAIAWSWLKGNSTEKPQQTFILWVAKETIPPGMVIKKEMIVQKTMEGNLPEGLLNSPDDIQGKTTKDSILKGEGFPTERILNDEENVLSMRLPEGNRAYSISVTQYSAVADLLKSGDRIDVFVFLSEVEKDQVVVRPDIASILLQDVEILGVRKELNVGDKQPEEIVDLYTLTLSVPVKDIEKLVFAAEKGVLKVALRPVNAQDTFSSYGVIWQELLLDPELNIRDFEPKYGTVENTDVLTTARANMTATEAALSNQPAATQSVPLEAPKTVKKATYTSYIVQPGDTLMNVSRKFYNGSASHYDDIMRINGLSNQTINPGQRLKIPLSGR